MNTYLELLKLTQTHARARASHRHRSQEVSDAMPDSLVHRSLQARSTSWGTCMAKWTRCKSCWAG